MIPGISGGIMTNMSKTAGVPTARPTLEGARVRLQQALGFADVLRFDPFLMLDDFQSDRPEDIRKIRSQPQFSHATPPACVQKTASTIMHARNLSLIHSTETRSTFL